MQLIQEGKATIKATLPKIVSKDMDVFYNPVMKLNRDISVLLLKTIPQKNLNIADPLAGSGIRSIRFLKELPKSKIKNIVINDKDKKAITNIKSNLRLNGLKNKNITLENKDAKIFLLESKGFDYIDIDPFGSPIPFLDAAVSRISRNGILAITATDTAALTGTYIKTCQRRYWSTPLLDECKHETALRILIRKVQLIAAQYSKALTPILSYYKDHYLRIFFRMKKGKENVDEILKQHQSYKTAGPVWAGTLTDKKIITEIAKANKDDEIQPFLNTLKSESTIQQVGFYDIHTIGKQQKTSSIPKTSDVIKAIKKKKHKAAITHFTNLGIKTTMKEKEVINIIKKLV